jgi:predicted anti-sigma-YlaC factor YlaD
MKIHNLILLLVFALALSGCASNPGFVAKALPGLIRGNEKKLSSSNADNALILETGRYYISYANAFIQSPAEMLGSEQHEKKAAELKRAKENYLRGVEILETAVDVDDDVDFLYWKSAGSLAAYSIDPFDYNADLGSKFKSGLVMLEKAYRLNPDYEDGALDELNFLIYASLPPEMGGDKDKAKAFFNSALEKANSLHVAPFVAWAQSVSVPAQNYGEYKTMLERALAINPNKDKASALANKINQKKAAWLLDNARNYFIEAD